MAKFFIGHVGDISDEELVQQINKMEEKTEVVIDAYVLHSRFRTVASALF